MFFAAVALILLAQTGVNWMSISAAVAAGALTLTNWSQFRRRG
jgi:hypothetical protein